MRRVVLSASERAAIEAGGFVKVDLGGVVDVGGVRARSALVGRAHGALRAYANLCRHHAIPLDIGMSSAMADDRYHLICHQHGALYRPTDGRCVVGPCVGESLAKLTIEQDDAEVAIVVP